MSCAVLVAGLIIWYNPEWQAVDPICTLIFCVIVVKSTTGIVTASVSVLLEQVPFDIKWDDVNDAIKLVKGVVDVHDLHIWSISHNNPAVSAHVSVVEPLEAATFNTSRRVLEEIQRLCKDKFNLSHSTIQVMVFKSVEGAEKACLTCNGDENENVCY